MPVKKKTQSKKRATAKKPAARMATSARAPTRRHPKEVEIDEPRQRAGDDRETAFKLETSEGTDALAEELGEEYVENVTGANDSASVHRDEELLEEQGSFVVTTGATEFSRDENSEPAPPPSI